MLLIPAIDLKDGKCVRLRQGEWRTKRFSPTTRCDVRTAGSKPGAQRLHMVDLNGAFAGKPVNAEVIQPHCRGVPGRCRYRSAAASATRTPSQLYLDAGVSTSSSAPRRSTSRTSSTTCAWSFPAISSSAWMRKDGKVAIDGWSKLSNHYVYRPGAAF